MNWRLILRQLTAGTLMLITAAGIAACAQEPASQPRVWLDAPRGNTVVLPGSTIEIVSHAYAVDGLAEVVFSINGEAYQQTAPDPEGAEFAEFRLQWSPAQEGNYRLEVIAYDRQGSVSPPDMVSISVAAERTAEEVEEAVVTEPPTPVVTITPEEQIVPSCPPLLTADTNANCRAGPGEIYDLLTVLSAGDAAIVKGRSEDSSWWVIQRPDAAGNCWIWDGLVTLSADTCQVLVFTPPDPPDQGDLNPPPVPEPMVPADGLEIDCSASQNLVWLPVNDPSGIEGYYLRLEKEVSAGSWQSAGSWGPVVGKQHPVKVDCGLRYRWSVRAEDGAGNFSPWSGYSFFSVSLD